MSNLKFLVLDEADRMLDMGFIDDVRKIIKLLPKERQTMLFSATIDQRIDQIMKEIMNAPTILKLAGPTSRKKNINQKIQYLKSVTDKSRALEMVISDKNIEQSIIFTRTKQSADSLAKSLQNKGYNADALHGDMRQNLRNKIIQNFRNKEIQFLVGTDVVARGIDVPGVSHVINYDLPQAPEDYVHRIGRTGRAEKSGNAITLAYYNELMVFTQIEKYLGYKIEHLNLDGFEEFRPAAANNLSAGRNSRSRGNYSSRRSRGRSR